MKFTLFRILALAIISFASCERQDKKLASEEQVQGESNETLPRVADDTSSRNPEDLPPRVIVSPATMNRIFKEAEEAFNVKDYSTAVAKYEELVNMLPPDRRGPHEMLYFQIGLGKLLGGNYHEAATAFKDCIQRFPQGEYTSRAYLGLGRACMMQNLPEKKDEALGAFKKAAADPKYKQEADLWISRISERESKKGENPTELQEHAVVTQLNRIVIPKVALSDASIEESFDFANIASMAQDPEADPARKGVSFILRRAMQEGDTDGDSLSGLDAFSPAMQRRINYTAKNVRYLDLIAEIARQGRLDAYLTSVGIIVIPEGSPPFPNGKASEGEIWTTLRIRRQAKGKQEATPIDGDKPSN